MAAAPADEAKASDNSEASKFLLDLITKNTLPPDVDLKDEKYHDLVFTLADALLASKIELAQFESVVANPSDALMAKYNLNKDNVFAKKYSGALINGLLIAKGRTLFEKSKEKQKAFHVTVIVPMYNEHHRLNPYDSEKNPLGQNFLVQKYKQMQWLFKNGNANYTWNMICMDDGCPNKSGELATDIIKKEKLENVCVRYLQEVIDKTLATDEGKSDEWKDDTSVKYFGDMKSTKDSRKGGAVGYGLYLALNEFKPKDKDVKHIIVATDSDLSMDLGQIGGLVHDLVSNDKTVASCGARYGTAGSYIAYPDGAIIDYTVYLGANRCRVVVRHCLRKLIMPALATIYDTQVGLKAFDSSIVDKIISTVKDRSSSFDMETLLTIENNFGHGVIATYPTYFVEDFESSNFTSSGDNPGSYFYPQCFAMVKMYDTFVKPFNPVKDDKERAKALDYITNVKPESFEEMCKKIEKDVMPKDAFLTYKLTMDDIIKATPK